MLEAAEPLMHGAGPLPFAGLQGFFDQFYPKGMQGYWRADFVNELSDAAIAAHVEHAERMTPGASTMHMYPIDGAVHDVGESDTAWSNRDVQWAEVIYGTDPDPASGEAMRQWTLDYFDATHPYSATGGAYVNFMMDEGQERVKADVPLELRPALQGEVAVRPGQHVPREPEHPAGRMTVQSRSVRPSRAGRGAPH